MILDEMIEGIVVNRKQKTSKDQVLGTLMVGSWEDEEDLVMETEKEQSES